MRRWFWITFLAQWPRPSPSKRHLVFYQRKKASKFSNYQGNAALGVYHYEAVNKTFRKQFPSDGYSYSSESEEKCSRKWFECCMRPK